MKENHLVVIPSKAYIFLRKHCEENKIEYKTLSFRHFPEGTPGGCTFRGIDHLDDSIGFESEYTKEEIYNLLEELIPKHIKFEKH